MTQVPMDELDPAERLATGGERVLLETFLDLYREAITSKVSGLSEEEATRRLVPSATTLIGIVKHLRWVELSWFQRVLAGRPPEDLPPVPWSGEDGTAAQLPLRVPRSQPGAHPRAQRPRPPGGRRRGAGALALAGTGPGRDRAGGAGDRAGAGGRGGQHSRRALARPAPPRSQRARARDQGHERRRRARHRPRRPDRRRPAPPPTPDRPPALTHPAWPARRAPGRRARPSRGGAVIPSLPARAHSGGRCHTPSRRRGSRWWWWWWWWCCRGSLSGCWRERWRGSWCRDVTRWAASARSCSGWLARSSAGSSGS